MRARKMRITLVAAMATRCESRPRWSSNTYVFLRDSVASSSHEASLRRAADIAPRCTRSLRRRRSERHATSAPWPDCLAFVEDWSSRGLPEAVVLTVAEIERRRGADDAASTGDRSDAGLAGTPSLVGGGPLGTTSPWDKLGRSHLGLVFLDISGNEARAMGLLFAGIAEGGLVARLRARRSGARGLGRGRDADPQHAGSDPGHPAQPGHVNASQRGGERDSSHIAHRRKLSGAVRAHTLPPRSEGDCTCSRTAPPATAHVTVAHRSRKRYGATSGTLPIFLTNGQRSIAACGACVTLLP